MLHLYCLISDADEEGLEQLREGVDASLVRLFRSGPLSILYSQHDVAPERSRHDHVLAHSAVVDRVHQQVTTVPLRFGTDVVDLEALHELAAENGGEWSDLLARLDGCVELGVRFLSPRESAPEPSTEPATGKNGVGGAEFLRRRSIHYSRREQHTGKREEVVERVVKEVEPFCREYRVADGELAGMESRLLSLLVGREESPALLKRLNGSLGGMERVSITGPWPPWNFVSPHAPGSL